MLLLLLACTGLDPLSKSDADTAIVADTDADTDADSDSDADTDSDTDSDTDADSDSDADTDTDSDSDSDSDSDPCPPTLSGGPVRGGTASIVAHTSSYDYAPAVVWDEGYKMWWCGGIAGDYVLYAEADSLDGPWHAHGSRVPDTWDYALQPTGVAGDFDGAHTCDPSVVRADGTWYLYYGGFPTGDSGTTKIGVASSVDGRTWTRNHGGVAIVEPNGDWRTVSNQYGAGQPSVVFKDGWFYLTYTDTTGVDVDGNGAGQFVLRSTDATFQVGVEELGPSGFVAYSTANHTQHALTYAFGVDWQFVDALDRWAMAIHGISGETTVAFFDAALEGEIERVAIAGEWDEGPGLVSRPDKHAVPSADCGTVPLDVVHALGADINAWELVHKGMDLATGLECTCVDQGAVLEGTLLQADGLPLTLVRDGTRLQFANAAPATRLSHSTLAVSADTFYAVPYGASLYDGNDAIYSDGTPGAFLLDDGRIWPVSCAEVVTENNSSLRYVDLATFGSYAVGPALYCYQ